MENNIKNGKRFGNHNNCIGYFSICQITINKIGLKVEDLVRRSLSEGDHANSTLQTKTVLKVADLPPLLLSTPSSKLINNIIAYKSAFTNLTFSAFSFILDIEETTIYVFHLL